jgi:hypothetical protein
LLPLVRAEIHEEICFPASCYVALLKYPMNLECQEVF